MSLRHEALFALRGMRRRPGVMVVVVTTLALGIGAVTGVFSIVDSVLLRPLPYVDADRLVWIGVRGGRGATLTGPTMQADTAWRAEAKSVVGLAAYATQGRTLRGVDVPQRISVAFVSSSFFAVLGTTPARGRVLGAADDRSDAPLVAVLSDSLWRTAFHADPHILGHLVALGDLSAEIVGVMPRSLAFPSPGTGAWLPIRPTLGFALEAPNSHVDGAVARLRPGYALARVRAELQALADRERRTTPQAQRSAGAELVDVVPLRERIAGDARPALLFVLTASVLVLVVACVNVAGVLLVRGTARHRELAIRTALGASQRQIMAVLLTECGLYAVAGVGLGLLLALWVVRLAVALGATLLPRSTEIGIHAEVLIVCGVLGFLATCLAGLAPALQTVRGATADALRAGADHTSSSRAGVRFREALVVAEVSLTLTLLVSAGALGRSVAALLGGSLGMAPEHVIVASVMRPLGVWPSDKGPMRAFGGELVRALAAQTDVRASAVALNPPATRDVTGYVRATPDADSLQINWEVVTSDYFRVLGIPVLRGRTFDDRDGPTGMPTLILSQDVAKRLFPRADPVGQRVFATNGDEASPVLTSYEVVGVVGDIRPPGPALPPVPEVYIPFFREPVPHITVLVRTDAPPAVMAKTLERVVHSLDPAQPVTGVWPLDELLTEAAARPRFYLGLLTVFAATTLVLAAVSLYGVLAFTVRQRTRELAIRRALGAPANDIMRLVVGRAIVLTLGGITVGIAGAWAAMRVIAGSIGTIGESDPVVLGLGAVILCLVALLASMAPVRQALQVDPMVAVRLG